ncbi:MAG: type I-E CRISPR-associated protein Cas7/Cse4/CasC [Desulfovibrionaceae bacterium]
MTTFTQIHMLTSYPPANLNRDDLGRPKTCVVGGALRLRISSQSLKRAWRTSTVLEDALAGSLGTRTKEMGRRVHEALTGGVTLADAMQGARSGGALATVDPKKARDWAHKTMAAYGTLKISKYNEKKPNDYLDMETMVHFSPAEIAALSDLTESMRQGTAPAKEAIDGLLRGREAAHAADIAMFGRMLATRQGHAVEAAVQVAHAFSVQQVAVESDFFTAVDDLNLREEDAGAGHMGETEFAQGLFYTYICVDTALLAENMADSAQSGRALRALVEAAATVAPSGKQNSFGSRAYASYVLAEKGSRQPRSLAVAFLAPVRGTDMLTNAIKAIESTAANLDTAYGPCADATYVMDIPNGKGTLAGLLDFVED